MSGCVPHIVPKDKTITEKEVLEYLLRVEKQLVVLQQMVNVIKENILT